MRDADAGGVTTPRRLLRPHTHADTQTRARAHPDVWYSEWQKHPPGPRTVLEGRELGRRARASTSCAQRGRTRRAGCPPPLGRGSPR